MKMVNSDIENRSDEVHNGNIIVNSLPDTNWFVRGGELLQDHKMFGDIGTYDLFLHKQDRCYSIPELHDFIEKVSMITIFHVDKIMRVDNNTYLKPFKYFMFQISS
jgi:hypothetical protein